MMGWAVVLRGEELCPQAFPDPPDPPSPGTGLCRGAWSPPPPCARQMPSGLATPCSSVSSPFRLHFPESPSHLGWAGWRREEGGAAAGGPALGWGRPICC